jgi:hypothetical protein
MGQNGTFACQRISPLRLRSVTRGGFCSVEPVVTTARMLFPFHCNNVRTGSEVCGHTQGRNNIGAGGGPGENTFFPRPPKRHFNGVFR